MGLASIAWHKKVAHTVHGFPALQESLRLLSDLMLPKHETILNTAVLLFLCGERESPPCLTLSRAASRPSIFDRVLATKQNSCICSKKQIQEFLFYSPSGR